MQRKERHFFRNIILTAFFSYLMLSSVQAAKPLWTFAPQTPTEITVTKRDSAQVIYTVHNQSFRPKILVMKPIEGISQSAPCQLPAKGSCTLTLNVNGAALQGDVVGGPMVCQQGNNLQCYQPSLANILRIRLIQTPVQQFTVIPSAGSNGSISPAAPQVVNAGSSLTFTAIPNSGYGVNQWLLDGNVVQTGGNSYQLNNIQANHTLEVTFWSTTLSPLMQNLTLSINDPGAVPALPGNARIIRIENTGSVPATNVQVSTSGLPTGTSITNGCTGSLAPGATCDITVTPGGNASLNAVNNPCTAVPGTAPVPATVTVSADNTSSTDIEVLVLGYGCIYQGGFLFSIDDATSNLGSIGGKVAALADEEESPGDFVVQWAVATGDTAADSITDGFGNTNSLAVPPAQYPAAQACLNKIDQGFTDWYLPAICELARFVSFGTDPGCGTLYPNIYINLYTNNLGGFTNTRYWSSSEFATAVTWLQDFDDGDLYDQFKLDSNRVRCVRTFTP